MKWAALFPLLLAANCGGSQDRLTDEQAMREAVPGEEQLAAGNSSSQPAPAVLPSEPGEVVYQALGTGPGWALTVRRNAMLYQGDGGTARIIEFTPARFAPRAGTYRSGRLAITIAAGPCSDGLSHHLWRDKVRVAVAGSPVAEGCGGGLVEVKQVEGAWTVSAINGRPTDGGDRFRLSLRDGKVEAVFGCNGLQGAFTRNGDHLAISDLLGTQMRCGEPADSFERDGTAVLRSNIRVEQVDGRTRLVSEAGSIELSPRQQGGPTA